MLIAAAQFAWGAVRLLGALGAKAFAGLTGPRAPYGRALTRLGSNAWASSS